MKIRFFIPLIIVVNIICLLYVGLSISQNKSSLEAMDIVLPSIELEEISAASKINLSSLKGPFVLSFFASWCQHCHNVHTTLMKMYDKRIPIYGIAWKDNQPALAEYFSQYGNPYQGVLLDNNGKLMVELGINTIPTTVIVDHHNHIIGKINGRLSEQLIESHIIPAMKREAIR